MGSPDEPGHRRGHPRLRALGRWLPVALLGLVTVGAAAVAIGEEGPPRATSDGPLQPVATPVLSLRRAALDLAELAADERLRRGLDEFIAGQPPDTCLDVEADSFRYRHRVDDPQSPASLQKLLTAVAALTVLGPDHRYLTEVLAPSPVDGVVTGDLHLRGGGDPVLSTGEYAARERHQPQTFTDIDRLADSLVASGVRQVTGTVVGDESRYDAVRYNPAWPGRFVAQGQIGPLSALSVNDGFAYFPEVVAGGAVFGPAPDPAAYGAEVLAGALRERGVIVGGPSRSGPTPGGLPVLADLDSPPLADIVAQMLRDSDNNTAELLVKEMGLQASGAGTFPAGTTAVVTALDEAGLDIGAIAVADGSGLATEDVVTCELVLEILDHEPTADELEAGLPVGGESGTLAGRFTGAEVTGRLRAKTGTLNRVTALAGSVDTEAPTHTRFSLIVNVAAGERVRLEAIAAQERLVELLVAHAEPPDVEAVRP